MLKTSFFISGLCLALRGKQADVLGAQHHLIWAKVKARAGSIRPASTERKFAWQVLLPHPGIGKVLLPSADEAVLLAVRTNIALAGHHVPTSGGPAQLPFARLLPHGKPVFKGELPADSALLGGAPLLPEAINRLIPKVTWISFSHD